MLAAIAAALYLATRNREFASGLCLAIPAAVKLFPPCLLLYPFWRRRWAMSGGVVLGIALTLALIPAVVWGPRRAVEVYVTWFEVLAKPALGAGSDQSRAAELTNMTATDNQSLLAAIHNWQYFKVMSADCRAPSMPRMGVDGFRSFHRFAAWSSSSLSITSSARTT